MDPASGTFTSMDTYAGSLSDPMSLHKYLFANSNPVMYSDPSGHYTLTEQETAIAIQAILGEAISGAFYIVDWFINDPDSKNHSIGKMIIAMMLGLARSAVMGSWGGLLSGLISKAGMSVLDYLLTGIMFALFSGNLKLAAINLRESGNFKVAAICNAGGAFADFVSFCSVINAVSTYAASKADNKSSKNKKYRNNKRGAVRIGGDNSNNKSSNQDDWVRDSGQSGLGQSRGGKHTPQNLNEQLAMQEAISNPSAGTKGKLSDPKWQPEKGWVKMFQNIRGYEVHYVYNTISGEVDDVKIK